MDLCDFVGGGFKVQARKLTGLEQVDQLSPLSVAELASGQLEPNEVGFELLESPIRILLCEEDTRDSDTNTRAMLRP